MNKIKYLYIPIGGIGKRLKQDLPELHYSSKCFLTFKEKTLLLRLIESCKSFCEEVVIVYCHENQRKDAYALLGDSIYGMCVHYIQNVDEDPYVCMLPDGDCIAAMGDSYVPAQTWDIFFKSLAKEKCLTFLRFNPPVPNQDYAYYQASGGFLTDWSHDSRAGYEHFEIGQLLYFPQSIVRQAVTLCQEQDALSMLRYFICSPYPVRCLSASCYNINTGEEYRQVSAFIHHSEEEVRK